MQFDFLEPTRRDVFGDWSRKLQVNGRVLYVSVRKGRRVRIPYKPRGQNIGFHWIATVNDPERGQVWSGRCSKSSGCKGIVQHALVQEFNLAAFRCEIPQ